MNKVWKFLMSLTKKEREYLLNVLFPKITTLDLKGLDVKPLEGYEDIFRIRKGDIRVIFFREQKKHQGIILRVGHRKDVYKKL